MIQSSEKHLKNESVDLDDYRNSSGVYGFELLIDLHGCDSTRFTRRHIDRFFTKLCNIIKMEKCDVHFWDDVGIPEDERQTLPHTKGTSAVCFILTSTIVVHSLDLLDAVFVNIFSCKEFDEDMALRFTAEWFRARSYNKVFVQRMLSQD